MLENLRENFALHDIGFQLAGIDYIDNDNYYSYEDASQSGLYSICLANTNRHDDGIDIYIYSGEDSVNEDLYEGGQASNPEPLDGVNAQDIYTLIIIGGISDIYDTDSDCNLLLPSGTDFAMSDALTHEMGHVFGLHHTFRSACADVGTPDYFCAELVEGDIDNRQKCGDYVADTPADPGMGYYVNNDCSWTGGTALNTPQIDANGNPFTVSCQVFPINEEISTNGNNTPDTESGGNLDIVLTEKQARTSCFDAYDDEVNKLYPFDHEGNLYAPSIDNYMAYIPPNCMTTFSNGQVDKMRTTIESHDVLQDVRVENPMEERDWFDDIPIKEGVITWSENRHIFGTVTVHAGARLKIEGVPGEEVVISFTDNDAGIVVKEGGMLEIKDAILNQYVRHFGLKSKKELKTGKQRRTLRFYHKSKNNLLCCQPYLKSCWVT